MGGYLPSSASVSFPRPAAIIYALVVDSVPNAFMCQPKLASNALPYQSYFSWSASCISEVLNLESMWGGWGCGDSTKYFLSFDVIINVNFELMNFWKMLFTTHKAALDHLLKLSLSVAFCR
ncbi:hypothetical protein Tco_0498915 [Tanacetum coccineum]